MCGIFGYVSTRPTGQAQQRLEQALLALAHRGPDGSGQLLSTGPLYEVGFAHTRLSILDLSPHGQQPMTSADQGLTLTYNGEIYNFRELRSELEKQGETFVSTGDTEVLLRALGRFGEDALRRLRGMFAFGLWDAQKEQLWLVRDRLGVKPLYYVVTEHGIAFSSELRALFATGLASRRVDLDALAGYLAAGSLPEPLTIVRGARLLPAGCQLVWDARHGARVSSYWQPPFGEAPLATTFDEAKELLRPTLAESVALRLVSDVPVGVFLSGGIDSSLVAGLAAQAAQSPLRTFNVSFGERAFDEAEHARAVASQFGCRHEEVALSAERAAKEVPFALGAQDQPSGDGLNTYFVSQAAREAGLSVALSGLGGDELFAGYAGFRLFPSYAKLAKGLSLAPRALLSGMAKGLTDLRIPGRIRRFGALVEAKGTLSGTYRAARGMFTAAEAKQLLRPGLDRPPPPPKAPWGLEAHGRGDPISTYGVLETMNYLRDTLLRDTDAMSMAHALEVRVPLVDHVLVEQAFRVPGRLKLARDGNKPLLVAAGPKLPETAQNRPKMGFVLPLGAWMRGPLRPFVEDSLLAQTQLHEVLCPKAVEALWQGFLHDEKRVSHARILSLVALSHYLRTHGITL